MVENSELIDTALQAYPKPCTQCMALYYIYYIHMAFGLFDTLVILNISTRKLLIEPCLIHSPFNECFPTTGNKNVTTTRQYKHINHTHNRHSVQTVKYCYTSKDNRNIHS